MRRHASSFRRNAACSKGLGTAAHDRRKGAILIVALVITMVLAGIVLTLSRSMRVELHAAANQVAAIQADAVERGAEQYLLAMLAQEGDAIREIPENYFQAVPIGEGYFWVLRPDYGDTELPLFGLVDESAKLNINTANEQQILLLPGMTEDLAAALIDWRDEDQDALPLGAESQYYLTLPDPYYAKDGPLETIEELLMVRGFAYEYLYGFGGNGPLGQYNNVRQFSSSSILGDEDLARGLYDLLTVYSSEPNTDANGSRRINISNLGNGGARRQLRDMLRQELSAARANEIYDRVRGQRFTDIFDFAVRAQLSPDEFDQIADRITTTNSQTLRGRININTAPRAVLACLSNLELADVDKLIAQRPDPTLLSTANSLSWVITALESRAVGLGNYITTRTYQYSADILAVSGNGRAFKRCRIVIDTTSGTPVVRYRRDITDRGWPMDPQLLVALRAGNAANWGVGNRMGSFSMRGGF